MWWNHPAPPLPLPLPPPSLQEFIQLLMPPLIGKWNVLKDEDKDLFPLLEVGCQSHQSCPVSAVVAAVPVVRGHSPAVRLPALL